MATAESGERGTRLEPAQPPTRQPSLCIIWDYMFLTTRRSSPTPTYRPPTEGCIGNCCIIVMSRWVNIPLCTWRAIVLFQINIYILHVTRICRYDDCVGRR